jgi:hypothetical protein
MNSRSLSKTLAAVITIASTLAAMVIIGGAFFIYAGRMDDQLRVETEELAEHLEQSLPSALWSLNFETIEALLRSVSLDERVGRIVLCDQDHRVLYEYGLNERVSFFAEKDIVYEGRKIGHNYRWPWWGVER